MIVFTGPGDTPESITHRYVGSNDAAFSARLQQANLNSFAWKLANESGYYAANRAVWLPLDEDFDPHTRDRIIREFDWMYTDKRAALAKLQKAGVSHQTLLGMHALTVQANQVMAEDNASNSNTIHFPSLADAAGAAVYTTLGNINDLKKSRMVQFTHHLQAVKGSLQKLASAKDATAKQQALQEYETNRTELQTSFHHELHEFKLNNNIYLRANPANIIKAKANKLQRKGWEIYDEYVMRDVSYVTETLKWVGRGVLGFDVVGSGTDVLESYFNGGDWEKEAVTEGIKLGVDYKLIPNAFKVGLKFASGLISTDIMTGLEVAGIVALDFTPIGWVAMIAIGALQAGVMLGTDKLIDWRKS